MTKGASPILQAAEEAMAGLRQVGIGPADAVAELEEKLLQGLREPETVLSQEDWAAMGFEARASIHAKPK